MGVVVPVRVEAMFTNVEAFKLLVFTDTDTDGSLDQETDDVGANESEGGNGKRSDDLPEYAVSTEDAGGNRAPDTTFFFE